eukprot:scaffold35187_cov39-Attheya_sp.AAC.1
MECFWLRIRTTTAASEAVEIQVEECLRVSLVSGQNSWNGNSHALDTLVQFDSEILGSLILPFVCGTRIRGRWALCRGSGGCPGSGQSGDCHFGSLSRT